jgi:hypothetical protein
MGKLVKYDGGKLDVVPTHHGIEHGIIEVTERGIRCDSAHRDIEAPAAQRFRKAARAAFDEIAAISDAADDRVAPLLGVDGEFGRGDDIPHHVAAPDVRVTAVAAVVGQAQLAAGKIAYREYRLELRAQGRRGRCISDHAGDGFALGHQGKLAFDALQ